MLKKISFFIIIFTFFCGYAMEKKIKQITLEEDFSNWSAVFDQRKKDIGIVGFSLVDTVKFPSSYSYWESIKNLQTLKNKDSGPLLKKILFIKMVRDFYPNDKKINSFNDESFFNWLNMNTIDEKNMFAIQVCKGTPFYYYLLIKNNTYFFNDEWAPWYMNIQDLNERREYVKVNTKILNIGPLGGLHITYLIKFFMDSQMFIQNVIYPVCKNLLDRKTFLTQFIKKFLIVYPINTSDKRKFVYSYCFFFNYIFEHTGLISQESQLNELLNLFNLHSGTLQYIKNNYLYDSKDIISIVLDTKNEDKQTKIKDFFAVIQSFLEDESNDLIQIIQIMIYDDKCFSALVKLLYEENPNNINQFLSLILDKSLKRTISEKIVDRLNAYYGNKYKLQDFIIIEQLQTQPSLDPISIKKEHSKDITQKIEDGKKEFEDRLNDRNKNDSDAQDFFKNTLIYTGPKAERGSYINNANIILDLVKDENQKIAVLAYFMDAAAKNSAQSISDLPAINDLLNSKELKLDEKMELADILCAPETNYYYFIDRYKKIRIGHSTSAAIYRGMPEAERNQLFSYFILSNDPYDYVFNIMLLSTSLPNIVNKIFPKKEDKIVFLTEYIQFFLAYHKNMYVFGYCTFFNELLNNVSLNEKEKENLFSLLLEGPSKDTDLVLDNPFQSDTWYRLKDSKDFVSFNQEKSDFYFFLRSIHKENNKNNFHKSWEKAVQIFLKSYVNNEKNADINSVFFTSLIIFFQVPEKNLLWVNAFLRRYSADVCSNYSDYVSNEQNQDKYALSAIQGILQEKEQIATEVIQKNGIIQLQQIAKPANKKELKLKKEDILETQNAYEGILASEKSYNLDSNTFLFQLNNEEMSDKDRDLFIDGFFKNPNNKNWYLIMDTNTDNFVLKESPYGHIYMNIADQDLREQFIKQDENYCFLAKNYGHVVLFITNLAELDRLNRPSFPKDMRGEFINIFVEKFIAYHSKSFVFGYVRFFNYMFTSLFSKFSEGDRLSIINKFKKANFNLSSMDDIYVLQDDLDFYSIIKNTLDITSDQQESSTERPKNFDPQKLDITSYQRQSFIKAVENFADKECLIKNFHESVILKTYIIYFLYTNTIEDINKFLKILYKLTNKDSQQYASDIKYMAECLKPYLNSNQMVEIKHLSLNALDKMYYEFEIINKENEIQLQQSAEPDKKILLQEILNKQNKQNDVPYELIVNENGTYNLDKVQDYIKKIVPNNQQINKILQKLKNKLSQFLSGVVGQLLKQGDISKYRSLVDHIILSKFLDIESRKNLANYLCKKDLSTYVKLGNGVDALIISESPFAQIYMSIGDIEKRTFMANQDFNLLFKNEYEIIEKEQSKKFPLIKNILDYMLAPEDFIKNVLNYLSDKEKVNFLNIYIEHFNIRHAKEFIFGYVNFFNTVINSLERDADVKRKIFHKIVYREQVTVLKDGITVLFKYESDFLSTWRENKVNNKSRSAFILAIKNEKNKQRMRDAFNVSKSLRGNLMSFLLTKDVVEDAKLKYVNDFFKIMYNFKDKDELKKYAYDVNDMVEMLRDDPDIKSKGKWIEDAVVVGDEKNDFYYKVSFLKQSDNKEIKPPVTSLSAVSSIKAAGDQEQKITPSFTVPEIEITSEEIQKGQPNPLLQPLPPRNVADGSEVKKVPEENDEDLIDFPEESRLSKIGQGIVWFFKGLGTVLAWPFKTFYNWLQTKVA